MRAAILLVALAVGLAGCGKKGPPSPPGPPGDIIYPKAYPKPQLFPKEPAPAPLL
jgi:predicted small lipoprotein YifL